MTLITEASLIVRNDKIPTGEIDGELVALDLERGDCFGMDRVGTLIWAMSAAPVQVATIIDRLTEDHEVDRQTCRDDVLPFIGELAEAGLVRLVEE
ncbi:MAG: PqqD family protein [Sphingomicrobium sp.]